MKVLTVSEVAEILKLHPRTIGKMARSGEIPATRIGRVWRFDESVVLDWFNQRLVGSLRNGNAANGHPAHIWNGTTRVSDLLRADTVQYTAERKTRREVLEALATLAMRTRSIPDYEQLVESLLEREEMCPTALEGGFAFPHPRRPLDHVGRPVLALLVLRQGVEFGAPDEQPTKVFVLVCSPDDASHVRILAHLARLFRSAAAVSRLARCRTSDEIFREVQRLEKQLIDRAHDAGKEVTP